MPLTNAEKQARHRERLRKNGLVLFHAWVSPEQARTFHQILEPQLHVTIPPAGQLQVTSARSKKKSRRLDPVRESNKIIVNQHFEEIATRRRQGEGPTAIAGWLSEEYGFKGTGATLNGFLPNELRRMPKTDKRK